MQYDKHGGCRRIRLLGRGELRGSRSGAEVQGTRNRHGGSLIYFKGVPRRVGGNTESKGLDNTLRKGRIVRRGCGLSRIKSIFLGRSRRSKGA